MNDGGLGPATPYIPATPEYGLFSITASSLTYHLVKAENAFVLDNYTSSGSNLVGMFEMYLGGMRALDRSRKSNA